MNNSDHLPKNQDWQKDMCPICNKDFVYPPDQDKPRTCGAFDCLYKLAMKILEERRER